MSHLECNTITLASGSLAVPQNKLTVNGPTPSLILFFATSYRKLSLTPFVLRGRGVSAGGKRGVAN
jgi:hypothetical protein